MERILLLKQDDLNRLTSISGTVDVDKWAHWLNSAQRTKLMPVLGSALFNKLLTDYDEDNLTGNYEVLYNEYVVEFLAYMTAYFSISYGTVQFDNAGAYVKTIENGEPVEDEVLMRTGKMYKELANGVELNMLKWLCTAGLAEYASQDCCDGSAKISFNWHI